MGWRNISQGLTTELNATFGEDIIFCPKGSNASYLLTGIYDEETTDITAGSLEINSYNPTLRIDKEQFIQAGAPHPKQDDEIRIPVLSKNFYISAEPRDDGYSEYKIELSKTIGGSFAHKRRY